MQNDTPSNQTLLRMDPDSGEIECLTPLPLQADSERLAQEGAWSVVSADEEWQGLLSMNSSLHDVGTEFDREFEQGLPASFPRFPNS